MYRRITLTMGCQWIHICACIMSSDSQLVLHLVLLRFYIKWQSNTASKLCTILQKLILSQSIIHLNFSKLASDCGWHLPARCSNSYDAMLTVTSHLACFDCKLVIAVHCRIECVHLIKCTIGLNTTSNGCPLK